MNFARLARDLARAQGLPDDRAPGLVPLLRQARLDPLRHRDALCHQGDPADGIAVLAEGTLVVHITDGDSTETVATLHAPALVGHIGVVDQGPRTASVLAHGPATVLRLSRSTTERLIAAETVEAERFRELLLAGMFQSLTSSTTHLRRLLAQQPGTVEVLGDGPDTEPSSG